MKRQVLGFVALTMLAACNRGDNNATPASGWKVGANSYTVFSALGASAGNTWVLQAQSGLASPTNGIQFTFGSVSTPVSGTYKVISNGALTAGQVYIEAVEETNPSGATYYVATGNDNVSATVTVNSGKISISLPDTWAKSISGSDSVKISANISQTN